MKIYLGFIDDPYNPKTIDYVLKNWFSSTMFHEVSLLPSLWSADYQKDELMYFDTNRLVMRIY